MANITNEQIIEQLSNMTATELNNLAKAIQEKFDISGMPTMAAGGGASAEASEEATDFDVKITAFDAAAKMAIIKFVKAFANLGLKEAKDYVEDNARKPIGEVMGKIFKKDEAAKLVADLKAEGATAEVIAK